MTELDELKIKTNKGLCEMYPFIIPRNVFTGKIPDDYDYSYTELDDGCGWFELELNLCEELKPVLEKADYLDKFRIEQIKEKFGSLRFYYAGVPTSIYKEVNNIVSKYEALSEKTCISCGLPAKMCNVRGWISPYCENCMKVIHERYNNRSEEKKPFNYKDYLCKGI